MRTAKITSQTAAVNMLLAGDQKALTALASGLSAVLHYRVACPECGSHGPHESNDSRLDPEWLCVACGYIFPEPTVSVAARYAR